MYSLCTAAGCEIFVLFCCNQCTDPCQMSTTVDSIVIFYTMVIQGVPEEKLTRNVSVRTERDDNTIVIYFMQIGSKPSE